MAGLYYIRENEHYEWRPIHVFMCGDEHGEENGFYYLESPDSIKYINEYTDSQFKAADKTALQLAIREKDNEIRKLQAIKFDLENQLKKMP